MYISNRETSGTPLKVKKQKGKLQLKLPTQTRSKQTVLTILDACSHLLIENGFFGVTTDRVAKAAGVSIGSLYQFFGNKESVVSALIQNLMKNDIEMLKSLAHEIEKTEPQNRVRFLVQSILEHFRPTIEPRSLSKTKSSSCANNPATIPPFALVGGPQNRAEIVIVRTSGTYRT